MKLHIVPFTVDIYCCYHFTVVVSTRTMQYPCCNFYTIIPVYPCCYPLPYSQNRVETLIHVFVAGPGARTAEGPWYTSRWFVGALSCVIFVLIVLIVILILINTHGGKYEGKPYCFNLKNPQSVIQSTYFRIGLYS